MANYMADVANLLGVEIGEEFEIDRFNGIYVLDDDGLFPAEGGLNQFMLLTCLLTGEFNVKKKSWKPETDECFCYMDHNGICRSYGWDNNAHSLNYYKIGNCYHTPEEAEENRDKWVEFYASDEILEV